MIVVVEDGIQAYCAACDRPATARAPLAGRMDAGAARSLASGVQADWRAVAVGGRTVRVCPECAAAAEAEDAANRRRAEAGFTLVELLVVILIVGLVAVLAFPAVFQALADRRLNEGARLVQAGIHAARDRAILGDPRVPFAWASRPGFAGVRLAPDPSFPIRRLGNGLVDPAAALVYSRLVPLTDGGIYAEGKLAVALDGAYPPAFAAPAGPLVLEESFWDREPTAPTGRIRANPTTWWWNVRIGDQIEVRGSTYTVCGPLVWGADRNPDLFVNWGPPGSASPLDRGDGPLEFLYVVNGWDDDHDGFTDEGFDGLDNDADDLADEADEWEDERLRGFDAGENGAYVWGEPYKIHRRPVPAPTGQIDLPAGIVIDATGWATEPPRTRPRSRVPVDPITGGVDLILDQFGRLDDRGFRSTPAAVPFGAPWVHLWIADAADVRDSPDPAAAAGRLVSIDLKNGRIASGFADPADPAGSVRRIEQGGGR